jgi:hypothetical protein
MKTICSQRKARRERLRPRAMTMNAPVKFLKDSEEFLFGPLFAIWGFPSHWGGIGQNHKSQ